MYLSSRAVSLLVTHLPCPVCREKAPGQRECDEAIEVLNGCIREVDQASLAAISQQLMPREDISMEVSTPTNTVPTREDVFFIEAFVNL